MNSNPPRPAHPHSSQRRERRIASLACAFWVSTLCVFLFAGGASALSFQVDFVDSTYDTQAGDTFSDLLAKHLEGSLIQSTTTNGLEDITTSVYAGGATGDYSILMTTTLEVAVAGSYTFQVGTDWGRGGAAALIDNATSTILDERVIDGDVWWAYDWDDPDVFTTTVDLAVGDSYTLQWVGFEGCCGGSTTVRFSVDGSPLVAFTETNAAPYVIPEPGTALLVGLGLFGLAFKRRR